jgi:hypothetical protein
MRLIESSESRLVGEYASPVPFVLLGALPVVLLAGLGVVLARGGAAAPNAVAGAVVLVAICSAPIALLGLTRPVTTRCVLDREAGAVTVERRFLLRGSQRASFPLADLTDVVWTFTPRDDGTTARLELRFRAGKPVVVFDWWVKDRDAMNQACESMRGFALKGG